MIDQTAIDNELSLIFNGNYNSYREWEYELNGYEIVRRFIAVFDHWDIMQKDKQESLIESLANTIIPEFSLQNITIKFSLSKIHFDPIRNAVLKILNSSYYTKLYVREIALNKTLYPDLVEHIKTNLEKGVYGNDSIEIAALLGIELKPGQR